MKILRGKACQSALQRGNGKRLTVMGEVLMDGFSDRGSIPLGSTTLQGPANGCIKPFVGLLFCHEKAILSFICPSRRQNCEQ